LFEIEVFSTGVVGPLLVNPGPDKVPVGTVMTTISAGDELPSPARTSSEKRINISPAARRLADENHISIYDLKGSGPDGVIGLADVERVLTLAPPVAAPEVVKQTTDFKTGMRDAIAAAMSLSNREIPHYYLASDIDMSCALDWLEERNRQRSIRERLLPVVLPLKAVALALKKVPQLNAHWVDGKIQLKKDVHIGFAISLRGGGLLTPALHNVDQLSLDQLMAALSDLITRTRAGKLRGSEMTDAGITVTSLGDLGVRTVFGVIYPPQVGLVGLGRIAEQPWVEQGAVSARPVLTATLAADHRASDGHLGAQFLDAFTRILQEPAKL
jgi:pyruvate dehydrogenase E2 component (dihydrolipoamide acetyltransferase)